MVVSRVVEQMSKGFVNVVYRFKTDFTEVLNSAVRLQDVLKAKVLDEHAEQRRRKREREREPKKTNNSKRWGKGRNRTKT